jgi:membrane protein implicated in regulation of membrane protease activity
MAICAWYVCVILHPADVYSNAALFQFLKVIFGNYLFTPDFLFMNIFLNISLIWFLVGFVFFILEFLIPGFVLFFFAVGAWIVSLLSVFIDLTFNMQLVIFLASTVLSILLLRKWLKKIIFTKKYISEIEDEFIGKTAIAETFIGPGNEGKVEFRGISWNANSEDTIQKGETVVIAGNQSIKLIVKSTKNHKL